jgi:cell division septation protein DedD
MRSTLEEEQQIAPPHSPQDREVTLSSTTLLAIFFGLALICALFFAFGYTLGRRAPADAGPFTASTQSGLDSSTLALQASNAQSKPSAAAPTAPVAAPTDVDPSAADLDGGGVADTSSSSAAGPAGNPSTSAALASPAVTDRFAPNPTTGTSGLSAQPAPASALPANGYTVQIAAVSNPADADVLVSALHKHGYSVSTRRDPADSLIHVQVGPFASRSDALAMRQKLLSDGYNAILK